MINSCLYGWTYSSAVFFILVLSLLVVCTCSRLSRSPASFWAHVKYFFTYWYLLHSMYSFILVLTWCSVVLLQMIMLALAMVFMRLVVAAANVLICVIACGWCVVSCPRPMMLSSQTLLNKEQSINLFVSFCCFCCFSVAIQWINSLIVYIFIFIHHKGSENHNKRTKTKQLN